MQLLRVVRKLKSKLLGYNSPVSDGAYHQDGIKINPQPVVFAMDDHLFVEQLTHPMA